MRIKIVILFLGLLALNACDGGFEELNTSPTSSDNIDPKFQLAFIWSGPSASRFTEWRSNLIISACWSQQLVSGFVYDTYDSNTEQYTAAYLSRMTEFMPETQDIIDKNEGTLVAAMALVFKVQFMLRMADLHGEIPYTEAFNPAENLSPKYEPLSITYNAFIDDLKLARTWIQNPIGENPQEFDPVYSGDLSKWEKLINSYLLRIGLRLSEVEPNLSQNVVAEALDAGVIESNDDMAWIFHSGAQGDDVNASGIGEAFQDFGVSGHLFRYSDVFVNQISDHNDPRETTLMATYDFVNGEEVLTNAGPGGQKGMIAGSFNNIPGGESEYAFAQPRRDVMVTYDQPAILMSHAEVEFNRAEVIARGWYSGDAKQAYESGIRSAMKMLTLYPNAEEIPDEAIDVYLNEPGVNYDLGDPITLINTQKWVALLFNGYEAWANQRRIDIPVLTPVADENRAPESDGTIPKRVKYPQVEVLTNAANVAEAISRQGPDNINTRLWWDVK